MNAVQFTVQVDQNGIATSAQASVGGSTTDICGG